MAWGDSEWMAEQDYADFGNEGLSSLQDSLNYNTPSNNYTWDSSQFMPSDGSMNYTDYTGGQSFVPQQTGGMSLNNGLGGQYNSTFQPTNQPSLQLPPPPQNQGWDTSGIMNTLAGIFNKPGAMDSAAKIALGVMADKQKKKAGGVQAVNQVAQRMDTGAPMRQMATNNMQQMLTDPMSDPAFQAIARASNERLARTGAKTGIRHNPIQNEVQWQGQMGQLANDRLKWASQMYDHPQNLSSMYQQGMSNDVNANGNLAMALSNSTNLDYDTKQAMLELLQRSARG